MDNEWPCTCVPPGVTDFSAGPFAGCPRHDCLPTQPWTDRDEREMERRWPGWREKGVSDDNVEHSESARGSMMKTGNRAISGQKSNSYNHAEAFCLMTYQDEKTGGVETLWNSRDGVTPFCISSKAGNPSNHILRISGVRIPSFVPPVGMRIFVDLTRESLTAHCQAEVERNWDENSWCGALGFEDVSKEEAVVRLVEARWGEGQPDTVIVTPEIRMRLINALVGEMPDDVGYEFVRIGGITTVEETRVREKNRRRSQCKSQRFWRNPRRG